MEAYQCDEFGFFVGMVECQRNPMRQGQFLIPRSSTLTYKPDDCNWYNFDAGVWEYKDIPESEKIAGLVNIVIEGFPTREQIKEAINKLMNML